MSLNQAVEPAKCAPPVTCLHHSFISLKFQCKEEPNSVLCTVSVYRTAQNRIARFCTTRES